MVKGGKNWKFGRRKRVQALSEKEARLLARRVVVDGVSPAKAVRSRMNVGTGYSNEAAMEDLMEHPDFANEYKSLREAVFLRHPDITVKMADRLFEGLDAVDQRGKPDQYARQKWYAEGRATLNESSDTEGRGAVNVHQLFKLVLQAETERGIPRTVVPSSEASEASASDKPSEPSRS